MHVLLTIITVKNMRIKTVPNRILQSNIKITSTIEDLSDEESADTEKDYDSTNAREDQDSYKVNNQYDNI